MKIIFILLSAIIANFAVAQQLQPTEDTALLTVTVTDFEGNPRQGEQIFFSGEKTKQNYKAVSDEKGEFQILLPEGDVYLVKIQSIGEQVDYNQLDIQKQAGIVNGKLQIQFELPQTYTLRNVHFDTGKATLKPESDKALNDLYEVLKLKPNMVIEIAGHTDNEGDEAANQKLSEERAQAVRDYLVKKGISSDRLIAKGYGEIQPVDTNETEGGRAQNRRTEIRIIKE